MCGRAREHRNRDRFGFYDGVERLRENRQRRDLYIRGAIRFRIRPRGRGITLSRRREPLYSHFLLYRFIVFHYLLPPLPPPFRYIPLFFISSSTSPADFEFIAPKRADSAHNILFVRSLCSDFITRHARRPYVPAYACVRDVTHVAASVDF